MKGANPRPPENPQKAPGAATRNPEQDPAFVRALTEAAVARSREFLGGIKAYQHHPAVRVLPSMPVVWQEGTTVLRDYNPGAADAPLVLVVPSLINRYDILDLDHGHSFLRQLAEHGFRPLVVDWDAPGAAEKDFALADYVRRLVVALDFVTGFGTRSSGLEKKYGPKLQAPNPKTHLLGYCMGGNLALAAAALRPDKIRTLSLLATPWDFHKPDPSIGPLFLALADKMEPSLKELGFLPVDVIQSLFAVFQPTQAMKKFAAFAGLDPAGVEARHFVLLEDWLNDGVPLTANVARECLADWYGGNRPGKFEWRVGDVLVDPRTLAMPAYVVIPGKDRIVPPESAQPLAKLLPHAVLHEPMTGHVGMIASHTAPQQVWAPFIHWLTQHM